MLSEIVKRASWAFEHAKPLLARREAKALCVIWAIAAGLHILIGHYNAIEVVLLALIIIPIGTIASVLVGVAAAFAIEGRRMFWSTRVLMLLFFDGQGDRQPRSLKVTLQDLAFVTFGFSVFAAALAVVVAAFMMSFRTLARLLPPEIG